MYPISEPSSRRGFTRGVVLVAAVLGIALGAGTVAVIDDVVMPARTMAMPLVENDTLSVESFTGVPMPEADAPGAPLTEAVAQSAHTVDIVVVAPSGQPTATDYVSDASVATTIAGLSTYWKSQSNGQITGITSTGAPVRYVSTATCGQASASFTEAAGKFGRSTSYYLGSGSHHLLVITPKSCGGGGLGTVGSSVAAVSTANGGMMWASFGLNDLDLASHEFGHNLGLRHSNVVTCPSKTQSDGVYDSSTGAYADGCSDTQYLDGYDVMGGAFSGSGGQVNTNPPALNVTGKAILGVLTSGEVQAVALPAGTTSAATTSTLVSTGSASGRRDLQVTDPRSGTSYYVQYRGGGGSDTGSLYAQNLLTGKGLAPGVSVLTSRADGTSALLQVPAGTSVRRYLLAGERITTGSGGVTVAVNAIANGTASITVTLTATPPASSAPAASASPSPTPSPSASPSPSPTPTPTPSPSLTVAPTTASQPATAPGAPTQVTAVPGDARATLSWTAPTATGGQAITGYVVTSGNLRWKTTGTGGTLGGLTNGTSYSFTVQAVNSVGTSVASAASAAVMPKAP